MVEVCRWLAIATLLDPRFKSEGFKNPERVAVAVGWLKEEMREDHGREATLQIEPQPADDEMVA